MRYTQISAGRAALTFRARPKDDVVFRGLGGEMVLLHLETGMYFGLNPMGTRIWELIHAHPSLEKVLDVLVDEFEVTRTRCQEDLLGFVAVLRENGLVELSG